MVSDNTSADVAAFKRMIKRHRFGDHMKSFTPLYISLIVLGGIATVGYLNRATIVDRLIAANMPVPEAVVDASIGKERAAVIRTTGSIEAADKIAQAPGVLTAESKSGVSQPATTPAEEFAPLEGEFDTTDSVGEELDETVPMTEVITPADNEVADRALLDEDVE